MFMMVSGCTQAEDVMPSAFPDDERQSKFPEGVETWTWELPLMIMVEDTLYKNTGHTLESFVKIGDDQILGYVSSVVDSAQVPKQNGEANFPAASDVPYARWSDDQYSDVVIVKFAYQWWVFEVENNCT